MNKSIGFVKKYFNYLCFYFVDCSFVDFGNLNNLCGFKKNFVIVWVLSWIDVNYKRGGWVFFIVGYDLMDGVLGINLIVSQVFLLGYIIVVYVYGLVMVEILFELGFEIFICVFEVGNNCVVFGVYYLMDIMGGCIEGYSNVFVVLIMNRLYVVFFKVVCIEVMVYFICCCEVDGYGDIVQVCIGNVGVNDKNGYYNIFIDLVFMMLVVDCVLVFKVYCVCMIYGFDKVFVYGGLVFVIIVLVVLIGVENLLSIVFLIFFDVQCCQVLVVIEIDVGYVFDLFLGGWQCINLVVVMSVKVIVGKVGYVVKIEIGNFKFEVVLVFLVF